MQTRQLQRLRHRLLLASLLQGRHKCRKISRLPMQKRQLQRLRHRLLLTSLLQGRHECRKISRLPMQERQLQRLKQARQQHSLGHLLLHNYLLQSKN